MRVGRFNPQPFNKAEKEKVQLQGTDRATVLAKLRALEGKEQLKALREYGFDEEADELERELAEQHLAEMSSQAAPVEEPVDETPSEADSAPAEETPEPQVDVAPVAEKKAKKQRKSNKKK